MPNTIEQQLLASLGLPLTAPVPSTKYDTSDGNGALLLQEATTTMTLDGTYPGVSGYSYVFAFNGNDTMVLNAYQYISADHTYTFVGGNGADTYKYSSYGTNTIYCNIADFSTADGDKIDISSTGLAFGDLTLTIHNNTWTTVSGTKLLLEVHGNANDLGLSASSFITDDSGSSGNDVLNGDAGANTILGMGGNDTISGLGGNDSLNGNLGNDYAYGGDGNDTVAGGQGVDFINGNGDNDTVNGNLGNDYVYGGQGNDVTHGGQGGDYMNGNFGDDLVFGDLDHDTIHGGAGNDTVNGGVGIDNIYGDLGNDTLTGGTGDADYFRFNVGHGIDVITDFTPGTDRVYFSTELFSTAAQIVAAFNNGVITDSGGGTVTLMGVTSITEADVGTEIFA